MQARPAFRTFGQAACAETWENGRGKYGAPGCAAVLGRRVHAARVEDHQAARRCMQLHTVGRVDPELPGPAVDVHPQGLAVAAAPDCFVIAAAVGAAAALATRGHRPVVRAWHDLPRPRLALGQPTAITEVTRHGASGSPAVEGWPSGRRGRTIVPPAPGWMSRSTANIWK